MQWAGSDIVVILHNYGICYNNFSTFRQGVSWKNFFHQKYKSKTHTWLSIVNTYDIYCVYYIVNQKGQKKVYNIRNRYWNTKKIIDMRKKLSLGDDTDFDNLRGLMYYHYLVYLFRRMLNSTEVYWKFRGIA